ncbi:MULTISPECIES: bifunctional 2-C-methyl-D-erythritol 4-phosphate cytidylyltransferase/2-C-methyl-D-erythritol 2,4-cyclodiphosphate synthase [unclassified Ruegeria]|uniref:bifunctional 2-C-methyl-D-erythritol 4-phosphate cytidylyltransferase/2-C-methyl-D-erythritol 2,4-cyclodiphosphate synthase n=1 Tax=unclassified Ruegeria TaxID=2625375 RepID=UPI00149298F7|nr:MULTISPECIES: bifunctional 2-C-methyl-D-erythritol 4-phosphate cytidylyltransferase/2-C-methyl-D-erythritol 2,4-cyclodiphosphate synthase [unclassified Ruegeria]NOD46441.1 bifunctional 2-C-methyl-D-erythritol 4-phosphate cytidylyltransferase/2-C-methyl-D-erythritol 2,4-cyclodiphosphate synthase [Ruegeria sp. HKCCD5849]NOD50259.1 bifunctional 2-C-methyl-D-erythritol 4-phosphate cytidylyltransferase/2-C-methyl-D-erythritol 2,4-cyclodiphosphate synthase [Ruegeria sp. HKCCD5851]NOD67094.1 bifunct
MTTAAIIVAAGRGLRAGGGVPKQWRILAGRRVADWTIERFRGQVDHIVLVLSDEDTPAWEEFRNSDLILASGGSDRSGSVSSGLKALEGLGVQHVLIHDVARPCVSSRIIKDVLNALETHQAAAPGLAVTDALWVGRDGAVTGTQDRNGLYAAQTPQGFHFDAITTAHAAHSGGAADDVEVARTAGLDVCIVPGDADNLKITRPEDFARAERIMGTDMDVRLGNGYDVHRFGEGDHVILCGVKVPHGRGLQGHSDADVGMHAVTDAIYGALAQGDIGHHFPPSDPQWKGAASEIFLRHAVELAGQMGYRISNVDCTLVCEYPKIGPHAAAMRAEMSKIMGLSADQVSVKATTSERLGFTGRSEGIASLATACLVKQ